jgi:uncharacterized cupin superfamily protein
VEAAELRPEPIPDGWVLAGAPCARAAELSRTPDGALVTFLWDCTAGEYLWRYTTHETFEIIEGEAIVDDGSGPRILQAGAHARFRAGSITRWRVPSYVKKVSYCRDPQPQPVRLAKRLIRKLRGAAPQPDGLASQA